MDSTFWAMVTAYATIFNALILGVGLAFTLRQLRFLRHSNELGAMTAIAEQFDSDAVVRSRTFIRTELPALMSDPTFRAELTTTPMGKRAEQIKPYTNLYEDLGAYVEVNAVSARLALLLYGEVVVEAWNLVEDATMIVRREHPGISAEFEALANRAKAWHLTPGYRQRHARLNSKERDRWLAADTARTAAPEPPGDRATEP
jgi:hypothetical protein